jgi:hypothetical protein
LTLCAVVVCVFPFPFVAPLVPVRSEEEPLKAVEHDIMDKAAKAISKNLRLYIVFMIGDFNILIYGNL